MRVVQVANVFFKWKLSCVIAFFLFSAGCAFAYDITGPADVCVGSTSTYNVTAGKGTVHWNVVGGVIISQTSTATVKTIQVTWDAVSVSGTGIGIGPDGAFGITFTLISNGITSAEFKEVIVHRNFGGAAATTTPGICVTGTAQITLGGYQGTVTSWQQSVTEGVWTTVTGTSSVLQPVVDQSCKFRAVVSQSGCTEYSSAVSISVDAASLGGALSPGQSSASDGTLTLSGHRGVILNWQRFNENLNEWLTISNTTSSLSYQDLESTTHYRTLVQQGVCPAVYSTEAIINAIPGPVTQVVNRPTVFTIEEPSGANPYSTTGYNYNNYVKVRVAKAPFMVSADVVRATADSVATATEYVDGLGRLIQRVAHEQSVSRHDIVEPFTYDDFGRTDRTYLPYTAAIGQGYRSAALHEQFEFYHSESLVAHTDFAYSTTIYEPSPLSRVTEVAAPGESWQPETNHTNRQMYSVNAPLSVRYWMLTNNLPVSVRTYAAGSLSLKTTTDEHGNRVQEFTDMRGNVVLKQVEIEEGFLDTYYIYDDFGNLKIVLPPEAIRRMDGSFTPSQQFLDAWAFQYAYDKRGRMVHKKVPGAGTVFMVYDNRDRLVLTQDANQRSGTIKKWTFTKYDALNRAILTGILYDAQDWTRDEAEQAVLSFYQTSGSAGYETVGGPIHGYTNAAFPQGAMPSDYLTVMYYDDYTFKNILYDSSRYTYKANLLADQQPAFFKRVAGLPTGGKVRVLSEPRWIVTVNYYDDKQRLIQSVADNYKGGIDRVTNRLDFTGKILATSTAHNLQNVQWTALTGAEYDGVKLYNTAAAGDSWVNSGAASRQQLSANASGWVELVVREKNTRRAFGLSSTNADAGLNSISFAFVLREDSTLAISENGAMVGPTSSYNKSDVLRIERVGTQIIYSKNGAPLYTSAHSSASALLVDAALYSAEATLGYLTTSFGVTNSIVTRRMEYDHADRLIKTWHKVNDAAEVLLAENVYNEIGQLVTKKLFSTDHVSFHQSVDYHYNIRGWLTAINDVENFSGVEKDYFAMDLAYDRGFNILNYNGNISGVRWKKFGSTDAPENYGYVYDKANRILGADYVPGNGLTGSEDLYTEFGISYDGNGNILTLKRNGIKNGERSRMDELTYAYSHGNQLSNVVDAGQQAMGFNNGATYSSTDVEYTYDANGSMITDVNKGITGIYYNMLNLPVRVEKGDDYICYVYDATGRKLVQSVHETGKLPVFTDYQGEYIYTNDTLQFINHEEGRVVMKGAVPEYQYHLKDHLGNVRVTFTTRDEVDNAIATLETANMADEQGDYLYYNEAVKVNFALFDHTNQGGTYYSTRLNGTANERTGLAKSISVMPGDTVRAKVYAKYLGTNSNNWTTAVRDLITSIANNTAAPTTFIDGGAVGSTGGVTAPFTSVLNKSNETGNAPKAFLNYLVFDRNYQFLDGGYVRLSEHCMENGQVAAHDSLKAELIIEKPGYVYLYLSNDNVALGGSSVEVYFDDFNVEHTKSPVIQTDDYYPFGLTFNSYQREDKVGNRSKFQGQEHIDDLSLGWDSFKWRNYQPDIGRFFNVDPLAEKYVHNSTYAFAENKVITFRELEGLEGVHYMEGNKHVVEKNVVVLLENRKTAKEGASEKQIKKVENQNKRIDARNAAKLESVRTELNTFYNGSGGKGATNSKGETVQFKFNVTGAPDIDNKGKTKDQRNAEYRQIGVANGIQSCQEISFGGQNIVAPAAVLTREGVGGVHGETLGAVTMRVNSNGPEGTISHEVIHSLGLPDNGYNKGGILNSPPSSISSSEVDDILNISYEKMY